jgi:hypothetical protein
MSYIALTTDDQVVSNDIVVSTAWSGEQYTLTSFFTSSVQEASQTGKFYLDVYQTASSVTGAAVQFQIAWGDNNGSGSSYFSSVAPTYTPSKDIYRQYRALILGDENSKFTFDYVSGSDQIAVISVERARYKQSFNPGSLTLNLANSLGNVISLTDNSQIQPTATFINNTQYYTLVSGSQGNVFNANGTPSGSYGYVFPDLGTIILNPNALALPVINGGLATVWDYSTPGASSTPNSVNNRILFTLVSGSGTNTGFSLQSSETISSNYIFCRVRNFEDNYTSNPTIIDSTGNLIYNQLIYSPVTYITTVGLYNDNNELLAVAKLSKPLQKDFTKEALIRVKMDF